MNNKEWNIILLKNSCPFWNIGYCRLTKKMIKGFNRTKEHYEQCSYEICSKKYKLKQINYNKDLKLYSDFKKSLRLLRKSIYCTNLKDDNISWLLSKRKDNELEKNHNKLLNRLAIRLNINQIEVLK